MLVAPCTRTREAARPVDRGDQRASWPRTRKAHAEAAIQSNYGLGRRLYESAADAVGGDEAYVEIVPAGGE